MSASTASTTTLRLSPAEGADRKSVSRLASLGRSTPPDGPVVLAEVDGEPVAALGLADGDMVADPRRTSASIVFLLHLRRLETCLIGSVWGC